MREEAKYESAESLSVSGQCEFCVLWNCLSNKITFSLKPACLWVECDAHERSRLEGWRGHINERVTRKPSARWSHLDDVFAG